MRQRLISLFTFRPQVVIDENNNEVPDEEVPPRPTSTTVTMISLSLLALLGTLMFLGSFPGSDASPVGTDAQSPKLRVLRDLSASSGLSSAPWTQRQEPNPDQEEICYDDGCLDAAFDLLRAGNFSVDPCANFFEFACGRWMSSNPVPPSASRWSRFNLLRDEVNSITQTILNEGTDTDDPKPVNQVKEFYSQCIDLPTLEQTGLTPLRSLLAQFGGWPLLAPDNWSNATFSWLQSIGQLRRRLLDSAVISVYVDRDLKNTSRNVIFLDQPSFGLPRSVLIDAPAYPQLIIAYRTYIVEVAQALGTSEPLANLQLAAQAIIDLEIELAALSISDEDRYNMDAIYNPYSLPEFQSLTDSTLPGFSVNWRVLLQSVFSSSGVTISPNEPLIVAGQPYLLAALPVFQSADVKVLADYLAFRVLSGMLGETTQEMRDIRFRFTQALTGAREPETRASSCAGAANNNFGMAIGVKYIEAAFDKEAKGLVDELVENLRISFKELVTEAEWMEEETKGEAMDKADAMRSFMAFPDWLDNATAVNEYYNGLELVIGFQGHFLSVLNLALWRGDKALKGLRVPTTQDEWLTYPGVVNAFYSPQHNSITFPAGILQPPFFGKTRPKSQNYGGIGMVIGHEITHGFDNQGSQFDKDGNAENWWDEVTLEKYKEKTQCIVDQYSKFYVPSVDMYVNGELTQGENIGDNGGVNEAFRAYRHYVDQNGREEGRLPGLEQLTPNQLFFLGYANIWCESITEEGLINQLLTDPHSPAEFRVIGVVRNSPDFAEAYACPVDPDGMNPPPEDKCTVW